jgi:hypothetical protein
MSLFSGVVYNIFIYLLLSKRNKLFAMRQSILVFFVCLGVMQTGLAQTVKNVQARAQENSVIISYDLVGSATGQTFDVQLKSSHNNFATPLKEVSGDVGKGQEAGFAKTITWNAMKEIGVFSGNISFEVVATLTFTPLQFTQPTAGAGVKIGKPSDVRWEGGATNASLNMQLMRSNQKLFDIGDVGNSGSYTWNVPKTLEKGENYSLRLLDPTKPNDAVMSAEFRLKKTSILVYIIPAVVLVGVGVAVLAGGGGGGGGDCDNVCDPNCPNYNPNDPACQPADEPLPPPPDPGG